MPVGPYLSARCACGLTQASTCLLAARPRRCPDTTLRLGAHGKVPLRDGDQGRKRSPTDDTDSPVTDLGPLSYFHRKKARADDEDDDPFTSRGPPSGPLKVKYPPLRSEMSLGLTEAWIWNEKIPAQFYLGTFHSRLAAQAAYNKVAPLPAALGRSTRD